MPVTTAKERGLASERQGTRKGASRTRENTVAGRESDAARGRRSASRRRRRRRQAAPSESYPGRSSGASVSQPTLRDAVIISIVCLPFSSGGGERGRFPTALSRYLAPSAASLFFSR